MGVIFDSPPLAKHLPGETERNLPQNAYRIVLDGDRLVWVTHEDGKEVRLTSEPNTTFMKRMKAQVISWLPIEWLL